MGKGKHDAERKEKGKERKRASEDSSFELIFRASPLLPQWRLSSAFNLNRSTRFLYVLTASLFSSFCCCFLLGRRFRRSSFNRVPLFFFILRTNRHAACFGGDRCSVTGAELNGKRKEGRGGRTWKR